MRVTRSASRAAAAALDILQIKDDDAPSAPLPTGANGTKRKTSAKDTKTTGQKKARSAKQEATSSQDLSTKPLPRPALDISKPPALVPAKLTFSFEEARQHLINADIRFEDIFDRMKCRPYEHLEQFDPFRTLTESILGQQISWMAARSIRHRFIRLFDPSLPEKPKDRPEPSDFFPSAHQVVTFDVPTLRTAGLSQRKAEYVLDLAARFADGRLSTEKLLQADDEELYEMLIAVRGIGRWTVDMFAIFSLRRPDILPVGDLGVQRGLLRWFLSRHSQSYNVNISPSKLPKGPDEEPEPRKTSSKGKKKQTSSDTLPALSETEVLDSDQDEEPIAQGVSSVPPAPGLPVTPALPRKGVHNEADILPTPFTPSINKVLPMNSRVSDEILPLPEGLTVAALKTRLDTKKKIKGAFLTPKEMEELTEPWKPYRSLGVYFMWALAD